MEFDYPAIATGVISRLHDKSTSWSEHATHVLINPIGMIGLCGAGATVMQLTWFEDGDTPVMIAGRYIIDESIYILVEQVMPMDPGQGGASDQSQAPEQPGGVDEEPLNGWDIQ